MPERGFFAKAEWDGEAGVWYVAESDLPGLVAEAETPTALMAKLRVLVPELVELNRHLLDWQPGDEVPIHFIADQTERIRLTG